MKKNEAGISVLELLITLSIMSVLSIASVWLVFTTLSLRDKTKATTLTQESIRVLTNFVQKASINSSTVTGSNTSLFATSANECWSLLYDSVNKLVRFNDIAASGCTPDTNPTKLFFPSEVKVNSFTVSITPLSTGGRQVGVSGVLQTILPFDNYQASFSISNTNVID